MRHQLLLFYILIQITLYVTVESLSPIRLDPKTNPIIEFLPGSSVNIGWIYELSDSKQTLGEFFCGYRDHSNKIFPLAIDIDGSNFFIAYVRGKVHEEKPTDDRNLLDRVKTPYAENAGSSRRRGLTLTSLQAKDAGEYFCGLHLTTPARITFGGSVTLKLGKEKKGGLTPGVLAIIIICPVLMFLSGGLVYLVHGRKKTSYLTKYSLADNDEESITSDDDENVVYEK